MLETCLIDRHEALGARLVEFNGWRMPIQYRSIVEEHQAVRRRAGLFDLGHMGRLRLDGPGAVDFMHQVLTLDALAMCPGEARYGLICQEDGGVVDDVILYHQGDHLLLVVNAGNRETVLSWLGSRRGRRAVEIRDLSPETGMIALQGPRAAEILARHTLGADLTGQPYYSIRGGRLFGIEALLARTGYTGEDGFEIYLPSEHTPVVWDRLLASGRDEGVLPCGLGARDTLRLEAAMPLYGHELTRAIDPLSAGLGFAVALDKDDFVGRAALRAVKAAGRPRRLACLVMEGKRVPRAGYGVFLPGHGGLIGDDRVGEVTSGSFSPTLERNIALAYLPADQSAVGTAVDIDIRGRREPATVVKRPFYTRKDNVRPGGQGMRS